MIVQSRLGRMRTSSPAIHLNLPLCVRLFQRVNQRRVDVQVAIESKEIDQQIASCSLCAADALSLSDIEANVIIEIERRDHLSATRACLVWARGRSVDDYFKSMPASATLTQLTRVWEHRILAQVRVNTSDDIREPQEAFDLSRWAAEQLDFTAIGRS